MKKLASSFKLQASSFEEIRKNIKFKIKNSRKAPFGFMVFPFCDFSNFEFRISNFRAERGSRGFTLLLSALIVSIVLAIGASISGLAQKELTLSSIGRDSQFAFYTADSGAECALYWDIRRHIFSVEAPPEKLSCGGQETLVTTNSDSSSTKFTFEYESNGYCVDVSVVKSPNDSGSFSTDVRADGFSTNCDGITTNPRVLQRSVELHY